MSKPARRTRRVIGLVFLAAAILLLVAGQTVLRNHLHGARFVLYWLLSLLLVALAMAVALIDMLAVRHQARRQQLDLLQNTLGAAHPKTTPPPPRTTRDLPRTAPHVTRKVDPNAPS